MAQIHTLKKNGESIYPVTHISAVVDDNGNTVTELISEVEGNIPTKVSDLENDKGYITEIPDNIATKDDVNTAIANGKEVFVAIYGQTTYAEILEAYNAGKNVIIFSSGVTYRLGRTSATEGASFFSLYNDKYLGFAAVTPKGAWSKRNTRTDHKLIVNEDNTVKITVSDNSATVPTKEYVDNLITNTLNTEV